MFAFSNKNIQITELENIYFSIEGDLNTEAIKDIPVIELMKILGNKYFQRNLEDSSTYHLANVFVSNLVLSLLEIGTSYLRKLGLSEEDSLNALFPLIQGNIDNIHANGFVKSLTGPAFRGDINTIKKHLEALRKEDTDVYNSLSLNLLKLARKKCHDDYECESSEASNRENIESIEKSENAEEKYNNICEKYDEIFRLLGGTE